MMAATASRSAATPLTIRLTASERAELERRAGSQSLSAYARSRLFDDGGRRGRARRVTVDKAALAEVLACLGASHLRFNLQRLAEAATHGGLAFDPEAAAKIDRACADMAAIRFLLMRALGMKVDGNEPTGSLSQGFAKASREDRP